MADNLRRCAAWPALAFAAALGWTALGAQQPPVPPQGPPRPAGQPGPPATGTATLAGRVVDTDSGEGIPGAIVTVGGRGNAVSIRTPPVLTDSQGRFAFTRLPAGSYSISANREGYTSFGINARLVDISEGSTVTDVLHRLNKLNAVTGAVRDDVGDPVSGTDVLALALSAPLGGPRIFEVRSRARTNDRGEYRLVNLRAGQYVICACTRDVIPFDGQLLTTLAARPLDLLPVARRAAVAGGNTASLDSTLRTYAPTFYPNTQLASRAEPVTLEKGETKTGIDISVATVRAVRVSGQVIGLPPSTMSAGALRLVPHGDVPEASAFTSLPPILVQPDGRFDFAGVTPGTYTLEMNAVVGQGPGGPTGAALAFVGTRAASMPPPPPPPPPAPGATMPPRELRWASETVVVGDDDVTGLVVAAQSGLTVKGRIEFAGSSPLPPSSRGIVQLIPMERRIGRPASYAGQIGQNQTFAFVVPPGRYVTTVPGFAGWSNTKAITAKGVDVLDSPLVVDGDIPDLTITLSDTASPSVVGTAELPSGEMPDEWSVLIFPADRRLWKEPLAAYRRFQMARLTPLRTFTANFAPGDYLLALSKGLREDWTEAATLEELARTATSVTLVDGDKKAVQVRR